MSLKHQKKLQRKRGFSLLELLVSLLIITAAIVTTLPNLSQAARMSQRSRKMVTAIQLARNLLNEVQLEGKIREKKEDGKFEKQEDFTWEYKIEKVTLKEIMVVGPEEDALGGSDLGGKGDLNVDKLFKIRLSVFWEESGQERSYETFSFLYAEK